MPQQPAIDRAIDGIVDGEPLDWDALDSQAPDEDRELLKCLRILGTSRLHRSTDDETQDALGPPDPGRQTDRRPSRTWNRGRYRLIEKGRRGQLRQRVSRVIRPQREIAIKILHSCVADAHLKERLLSEGRALAKVRHANVVSVFGVEAHGDRVGLCMEFVHGATLESELLAHGMLTARDATMVGEEVCLALSAVHAAGFVHRDVKARNVMREEGGRIVLMDFGTGREAEELKASARVGLAGTPFMAPEVLAGLPASESSDLRSWRLAYASSRGRIRRGPIHRRVARPHMRAGGVRRASTASFQAVHRVRSGRWRQTRSAGIRRPTIWARRADCRRRRGLGAVRR